MTVLQIIIGFLAACFFILVMGGGFGIGLHILPGEDGVGKIKSQALAGIWCVFWTCAVMVIWIEVIEFILDL